jgi:coatomer subunit beta'
MPLRLDIKRRLTARSDRVKSCDLHPTEQWMLVSLYNGNVHIWNYESQQLVKSFEVCELPVRAAVFVPRKNWVITGSDDMQVLVDFVLYIALLLKGKMLFDDVPIIRYVNF